MHKDGVHAGGVPGPIDSAGTMLGIQAVLMWQSLLGGFRRSGGRAIALLCLVAAVCAPGCEKRVESPAKPDGGKAEPTPEVRGKILVVHSYHPEYEWVAGISRGIQRALETTNVELETLYMDTKRRTDAAWKEASGKKALDTMGAWNPDVVIAVDDNAQQYFAKHLVGRNRPQVVFCGVNGDPSDYGYPASNVTGILERPYLAETIKLLREIVPGIKRIAVLTDDSPTSAGAMEFLVAEECQAEIVAMSVAATFPEWQRELLSFQDRADAVLIFTYHTVKPGEDEQSMEPREVAAWTVANSRIPVFGMYSFSIDDGMLCGVAGSAVEHGIEAGRLARELLAGTEPSEIPVITAVQGHRMLNLDTARRLGLEVPEELIDSLDVVVGETHAP